MANAVRLYIHYLGISIRAQMQYRASVILLMLGHFIATGVEFVGVWAMFEHFGQVEGWTLPEVCLFYGLVNIAFSIGDAFSPGFDRFGQMVKRGDFDRLLLRPRSTTLQLAGQELTLRRGGRMIQGALVLAWGVSELDLHWTLPMVGLALAATIGGACLFFGLIVLQATLAFWTTESLEVLNTVTYGGVQTAQYPLSIYGDWLRKLFTYVVPVATAYYYPVLAILGKPDPFGAPSWVGWLSPPVGFIFLAITLQAWKIGERHYCSTGS
ncbi:MAG: ABC transporter permease [Anaerolineae bacterium]